MKHKDGLLIMKKGGGRDKFKIGFSSIYILCVSGCLFVSYKRPNYWTDQAQREGLMMLRITKISPKQFYFHKTLKIYKIYSSICKYFFLLLLVYNVQIQIEQKLKNLIENRHEAKF